MAADKIEVIYLTVKSAIIAGFGGVAHYLYEVSKGREFKMGKFMINIFLAGFVGYLIGEFLPNTFELRDSFIAMGGFAASPILNIIEKQFPSIFESLLNKTNNK